MEKDVIYGSVDRSPLDLIEHDCEVSRERSLRRHNEHVMKSWRRRRRRWFWKRWAVGTAILVPILLLGKFVIFESVLP